MKHSPQKKLRKLADAVFRGQQSQYSFKVYPLTAEVTDQPAIFIISRRVTDRFGKGHHAAVCIGETDSIVKELRSHKRAKCAKQHAANVVCILKEQDANARVGMIDDLTSARSFSCIRNAYKSTIDSKPAAKKAPAAKSAAKTGVTTAAKATRTPEPRTPIKSKAKSTAESKVAAKKVAKKQEPAKSVAKPAGKKTTAKPVKKKTVVTKTAAKAGPKKSAVAKAKPKKAAVTKSAVKTKPKKAAVTRASKKTNAKKTPAAKSIAPNPKRAAAKRATAPAAGTRVPRGMDRNGQQHRLSKQAKSVAGRAKGRTAAKSGSRKKTAA